MKVQWQVREIDAAYERSRMAAGDIVYSIRGSFGDVEPVPNELEGCNLTQDTARISAVAGINRTWLLYVLKSDVVRKQLDARSIGVTIKGINIHDLRRTLFPLPPQSEQDDLAFWLSTKVAANEDVSEKCAESIERLTEYRSALITAAVTGRIAHLNEDTVVTLRPKRQATDAFKRTVLAARIAERMCAEATFGRVKFQKALHLCEAHGGAHEVAGEYRRHAAGPFDSGMMRSVEKQLQDQGWITVEAREGGKGTSYARGPKLDGYRQYYDSYFADRDDAIGALLDHLTPMNTEQAEIVSTAYAAWNDLLLDGQDASDEAIVHLILNEWTAEKRNVSDDRWHAALDWMRQKGLVPRGDGPHTRDRET